MLQRIVTVAKTVQDVIDAVLLAVFLGLMAMVLAVHFGAGWQAAIAVGMFGLAGVYCESRRNET